MSDKDHALVLDAESRDVQTMHPMAAAILKRNPDADTLRKLLDVQREWEADEARKAYAAALVGLKRDLPTVIDRDATVDFGEGKRRTFYKNASLAHIMDEITEPLTAHGFSLAWRPSTVDRGPVSVTCRLTHSQGHHEEATLSAPADTSGNKNPAQAVSSTVTLLSRYTALSILGIATADMAEDHTPPAPAPDAIDTARNMRAAKAITDRKLSMDDARAQVGGRGPEAWTAADLDVLRKWIAPAEVPAADSDDPDRDAALDAYAAEHGEEG